MIGFNFGPKMSLSTDVQLRIRNSTVERLELGIATTLGPFPIVSFGVLGTKVLGGYELEMAEPLSPDELRYTGPKWATTDKLNTTAHRRQRTETTAHRESGSQTARCATCSGLEEADFQFQ